MQTLHLGMNMLKGRIGLEWDSWMAGMEKTVQWRAGKEDQRRRQALLPPVVLRARSAFQAGHQGIPQPWLQESAPASALRPGLECCRQLEVT